MTYSISWITVKTVMQEMARRCSGGALASGCSITLMQETLSMAQQEEPWDLVIGRVVAPFGTKGELRLRAETDFPERFHQLSLVCLELRNREERLARVVGVRLTSKGILVKFEGCCDRSQAEKLRGAWVKIRKSMAAPLPEGAYWVHEIIGVRVFSEEGRDLGEITEVLRTPANDVYVTAAAMIPALRQVVREIDLEQRRMTVSLPPEEEPVPGEGPT